MCYMFYSSVLCSVLLYSVDLSALLLFWFFLFGMHIFWFGLIFHALPSFLSCIIFVVQNSDLTTYKFSSVHVL